MNETSSVKMAKVLASLRELQSDRFVQIMSQINQVARSSELWGFTTTSRIWEYPWVWLQLEALKGRGLSLLDIGSAKSPLPWFLAQQGFNVIVSDVTTECWGVWRRTSKRLGARVERRILDAQKFYLPTASIDIYSSVSVIEHVPNKAQAINEAARVLRPGGLLITTFDICEPEMGMTFPEWNGRALSMRECDALFRDSPWFEPGLSDLPWNTDEILDYLAWNRTTHPLHNYVTGAAVIQRNLRPWPEPFWRDYWRSSAGKVATFKSVILWYARRGLVRILNKARTIIYRTIT